MRLKGFFKDKIEIYSYTETLDVLGSPIKTWKVVTTAAQTNISFTNSGTADYIDRAAGSFITDGFMAGQNINVDSASNLNDGNYIILTVAATRLTLTTNDSLTTETAGAAGSTTIKVYTYGFINENAGGEQFQNGTMTLISSAALFCKDTETITTKDRIKCIETGKIYDVLFVNKPITSIAGIQKYIKCDLRYDSEASL